MKRFALISSTALVMCAAGSALAAAQDSLQTVKELYAAAAYEDALAAMGRLQSDAPRREVEQYRVFSLTALGRTDEAQKAMEALIQADPSYTLDPAETPPRVQAAFTRVQQRMLPVVTKQLYQEARAALDRKDRKEAIERFDKLVKVIDSAGTAAASLGDLRVLAEGFLDLSRALPAAAAAAAAPPPVPAAPSADEGGSAAAEAAPPAGPSAAPAATRVSAPAVETRPVAISQTLPPWLPSDSLSRRGEFSGSVKVNIGVDGRVMSAELVDSVHATYDSSLLRAARNWVYQPAKRNGVPVVSELLVEVNLRPPQ
jgi:TonB family protein